MCRVLSVSPSLFYAWRATTPTRAARQAVRDVLAPQIRAIFDKSKGRYGAPHIHAELWAQGLRIGRKTVAKITRENGIHAPRRGRRIPRMTDSQHTLGSAPNLLKRGFHTAAPDRVWLSDISYMPTDEGSLYLAAVKGEPLAAIGPRVMANATKEIAGWSMPDGSRPSELIRSECEISGMILRRRSAQDAEEAVHG